jgi:hypothetical protein
MISSDEMVVRWAYDGRAVGVRLSSEERRHLCRRALAAFSAGVVLHVQRAGCLMASARVGHVRDRPLVEAHLPY